MCTRSKMEDKNYYEILECNKESSLEELKRNYQRLILTSHPDKNENASETFLLIQEAWSVLRDPETRRLYDATLACEENSEILLYDKIKLSDMSSSEDGVYTYNCRCGGIYFLEDSEFLSRTVIGCDECSFSIQVDR